MIISIIKHEVRQAILSSKTWYCLAALHALMGIIFNWLITMFLKNQVMLATAKHGITEEVVHPYYAWFTLIILIFVPMLSSQTLCTEKSNRTIVNYYCAPISSSQFILGKFLAINLIMLFILASISILPLSIIISGSLDWGQYAASILGVYLILSSALAIGLSIASFMSSVARSNIIIFFSLLSFILFEWAAQFTGSYAMLLQTFGLLYPLKSLLAGSLNLQQISYYLLIISSGLITGSLGFIRGRRNV